MLKCFMFRNIRMINIGRIDLSVGDKRGSTLSD